MVKISDPSTESQRATEVIAQGMRMALPPADAVRTLKAYLGKMREKSDSGADGAETWLEADLSGDPEVYPADALEALSESSELTPEIMRELEAISESLLQDVDKMVVKGTVALFEKHPRLLSDRTQQDIALMLSMRFQQSLQKEGSFTDDELDIAIYGLSRLDAFSPTFKQRIKELLRYPQSAQRVLALLKSLNPELAKEMLSSDDELKDSRSLQTTGKVLEL